MNTLLGGLSFGGFIGMFYKGVQISDEHLEHRKCLKMTGQVISDYTKYPKSSASKINESLNLMITDYPKVWNNLQDEISEKYHANPENVLNLSTMKKIKILNDLLIEDCNMGLKYNLDTHNTVLKILTVISVAAAFLLLYRNCYKKGDEVTHVSSPSLITPTVRHIKQKRNRLHSSDTPPSTEEDEKAKEKRLLELERQYAAKEQEREAAQKMKEDNEQAERNRLQQERIRNRSAKSAN